MGAESPVRLGRLSPRDPGVTGVVGEVWSSRRCTRMFGDHLPVGPPRPGLALVFGSRSRVVSSTGVQAFSKAHGGRGTIRTVTETLLTLPFLLLMVIIGEVSVIASISSGVKGCRKSKGRQSDVRSNSGPAPRVLVDAPTSGSICTGRTRGTAAMDNGDNILKGVRDDGGNGDGTDSEDGSSTMNWFVLA
jgi:hypothetical protein